MNHVGNVFKYRCLHLTFRDSDLFVWGTSLNIGPLKASHVTPLCSQEHESALHIQKSLFPHFGSVTWMLLCRNYL